MYRFAIQTEGRVWWLNALGISLHSPLANFDFKLLADFEPISWLQRSVFYQIFPDRFANGDPGNDPLEETDPGSGVTRKTHPWGEPALRSRYTIPFYGGDLAGIEARLGYLERLGANALYLNPIFTAYTDHRYDVSNFREVDPVLGGDEALVSLRRALDRRDMRVVLDIVPTHCGYRHPWFQSALQNAESDKRGYFYFKGDSSEYVSWMGFRHMPKLNYANESLRREMIEDEDSIFAHWLKLPYSADGWRLDVGNMLGRQDAHQINPELLRSIRTAVKRVSGDAYLLGENFFEAADQLQGDGWDGVMNYAGFADPILNWLKGPKQHALRCEPILESAVPWDTDALLPAWQENLASIPWQIALQQLNLLDSRHAPPADSSGWRQGAAGWQRWCNFVFLACPACITAMRSDWWMRKASAPAIASWDEARWDAESLAFYRTLIALRRESPALAEGALRVLTLTATGSFSRASWERVGHCQR